MLLLRKQCGNFFRPARFSALINEDIQRTNVLISLLPEDRILPGRESSKSGITSTKKIPFSQSGGYVCGLCELECNYQSQGRSHQAQTSQAIYLRHLHLLPRQKRTFSDRKKQSKGGRCRRRNCRSDVRVSSEQKRARSHHFRGSDRLGELFGSFPSIVCRKRF